MMFFLISIIQKMIMKVAIHQVNYFPWGGYFNKMAKSDIFIFLDEVQLAVRGYSQRTFVISNTGKQSFLNVGIIKKGHREKKFCDIMLNSEDDWKKRQFDFLRGNYSSHPYYKDVMDMMAPVFDINFSSLLDVTLCSVNIIRNALEIRTPTVMQSGLLYDKNAKKSNLMLELTRSVNGTIYLSGNGARQYMDIKEFMMHNVDVEYQVFKPFKYPQWKIKEFVAGLSILDMLFNIGVTNSRELFWTNIQNEEQIEVPVSEN